jgi:hypothetical protein
MCACTKRVKHGAWWLSTLCCALPSCEARTTHTVCRPTLYQICVQGVPEGLLPAALQRRHRADDAAPRAAGLGGLPAVLAYERPPQRASAVAARGMFVQAAALEPEHEEAPAAVAAPAAAAGLPRRKRGRPRKHPLPASDASAGPAAPPPAKRKRCRPRKVAAAGPAQGFAAGPASGALLAPLQPAAAAPAAANSRLQDLPSLGLPLAASVDWRVPDVGQLDMLSPWSRRAPSCGDTPPASVSRPAAAACLSPHWLGAPGPCRTRTVS